jgi:hypothetical protein
MSNPYNPQVKSLLKRPDGQLEWVPYMTFENNDDRTAWMVMVRKRNERGYIDDCLDDSDPVWSVVLWNRRRMRWTETATGLYIQDAMLFAENAARIDLQPK